MPIFIELLNIIKAFIHFIPFISYIKPHLFFHYLNNFKYQGTNITNNQISLQNHFIFSQK